MLKPIKTNHKMVGWRFFKIKFLEEKEEDSFRVPVLTSLINETPFWSPVMSLTEKERNRFVNYLLNPDKMLLKPAGLHSYKNLDMLKSGILVSNCYAKVVNYGLVFQYENIYRAEKSLISSIWLDNLKYDSRTFNFIIKHFQNRYQCKVRGTNPWRRAVSRRCARP